MNFKKIVCGLLSLIFILSTEMSVNAISMKKILEQIGEMGYFEKDDGLDKIKERTLTFLMEERRKKLSFYDHASERSDSLAFAFFCYLCVSERNYERVFIEAALNKACGSRSASEHSEDMAVINDILPKNSAAFAERFGVLLDEKVRLETAETVEKCSLRSVSPDPTVFGRYESEFDTASRRRERKPKRKLRETMMEGIELAEDGYGD